MEETFLLCAADISHMTSEDTVQSAAVPGGGQGTVENSVMLTLQGFRKAAGLTWTRTVGPEDADAGRGQTCLQQSGQSDPDTRPAATCRKITEPGLLSLFLTVSANKTDLLRTLT